MVSVTLVILPSLKESVPDTHCVGCEAEGIPDWSGHADMLAVTGCESIVKLD